MRVIGMIIADQRGDPLTDCSGGVGHCADDWRLIAQHALKTVDRGSCRDIDKNTVLPLPKARKPGNASPIICGFTAITQIAGSAGRPEFNRAPWATRPCTHSLGYGSSTLTEDAGNPLASQPCNMADPILPHPNSTKPCFEISLMFMACPAELAQL